MGTPARKLNKFAITDRKGLENHIKRIGTLGREIAALQADMDAEAAKAIRPFLKKIERRRKALRVLDADAVAFCETFRGDLLSGAKGKTVQLATGTVQFKAGRSKVVLEMDEGLVIAQLHEAGHDGAIRVKHSIECLAWRHQ